MQLKLAYWKYFGDIGSTLNARANFKSKFNYRFVLLLDMQIFNNSQLTLTYISKINNSQQDYISPGAPAPN